MWTSDPASLADRNSALLADDGNSGSACHLTTLADGSATGGTQLIISMEV